MKSIEIEYIYIFYAIFLGLISLIKNRKAKFWIVYLTFILLFIMAEIGADYDSYNYIYQVNTKSRYLHGEILYFLLNRLGAICGVSYNVFRVLYLSGFLFILMYSLDKMLNNATLCFLFYYLFYLAYLISAYRQFAVISIFIFSIYIFYYETKMRKSLKYILILFINVLACLIHKVAMVQLLLFIFLIIYNLTKIRLNLLFGKVIKNLPMILLLALIVRFGLFELFSLNHFDKIFQNYSYFKNLSLCNYGYVVRLIIVVVFWNMYNDLILSSRLKNLFYIYILFMLLYFVLPFEIIMGRMINTFRFLEPILFMKMIDCYSEFQITRKVSFNLRKKYTYSFTYAILAVSVFVSQLMFQSGYEYVHMFLQI